MALVDKALREALVKAIQAENEGQYFYLMAARSTGDEQGRRMFEALARDEQYHEDYLKRQHAAVLEQGTWDATLVLPGKAPAATSSPIFSPAIKARASEAHFELTALSVGIQLEDHARSFYADLAKKAKESDIKAVFAELESWESVHFQILTSQYEVLKSGYWADAGFAPF